MSYDPNEDDEDRSDGHSPTCPLLFSGVCTCEPWCQICNDQYEDPMYGAGTNHEDDD